MLQSIWQCWQARDLPLTPMKFTRIPIIPQYWGGGTLAMAMGLLLGIALWLWRDGWLPLPDDYMDWRLLHARIQILLFIGSFLIGFSLQAGPNVVGGQPANSRTILALLIPIWGGFGLTLIPEPTISWLGNGLLSLAYLTAGGHLLRMTWLGDPTRRLGIGIPLAAGIAFQGVAAWLPLADPTAALAALWCGPITAALAAGQQLLANVMGGRRLTGFAAIAFLALLTAAWGSALAAAFGWIVWQLAALPWLAVLILFFWAAGVIPAVRQTGFTSLTVAQAGGLFLALVTAMWLLLALPMDGAVHILGAGAVTLMIMGVASRVTAFFAANYLMPDRALAWLLLTWLLVVLVRVWSPASMVPWFSVLSMGIWFFWAWRLLPRLRQIWTMLPPTIPR